MTNTPAPLGIPYMGIREQHPSENYNFNRPPTPNDNRGYFLGDRWIDKAQQIAYILVSLAGGVATWIPMGGPAGNVNTLTGDVGAPVIPVGNNINIQGGAAGAILFSNGGPGQMDATVQVDGVTMLIVAGQLVATAGVGGVSTLSVEGGAPILPVGNNFDFSGDNPGAIQFTSTGAGLIGASAVVDNSSIEINIFNQLQIVGSASGITTTVGAVIGTLITFPMGAIPGTRQFDIIITGFDVAGTAGAGYLMVATARTDGVNAFVCGTADSTDNEDPAFFPADIFFTAVGNNVVVTVLGVAGFTINWRGLARSVFVS